jgi:hypothetical protein
VAIPELPTRHACLRQEHDPCRVCLTVRARMRREVRTPNDKVSQTTTILPNYNSVWTTVPSGSNVKVSWDGEPVDRSLQHEVCWTESIKKAQRLSTM